MVHDDKELVWLHGEIKTPPFTLEARIEAMDAAKRTRLEADGWQIGSAADFLSLTPEETVLVEMKVALSDALRRRSATLTTTDVAKKVHASIGFALAEEDDGRAISLEWLIRAMLAIGATPQEIGTVIARAAV